MIRIADHTERLEQLHKSGDEDGATRELDRICEELFGMRFSSLPAELHAEVLDEYPTYRAQDAVQACRELGYDLVIEGWVLVPDWRSFAVMVFAKHDGFTPKGPDEKLRRDLERDRDHYMSTRRRRR